MQTTIRKVLFIQKIPLTCFGVISLSAMLNSNGYATDVIVTSLENKLNLALKKANADLICITAMSTERSWAQEIVSASKQVFPDTPVVIGGIHAILYPEDAINIKGVDYVCNSEGEDALLNLIKFITAGSSAGKGLKGIWLRDSHGNIIRNEVEDLTENISRYIENRKIYYLRYPEMAKDKIKFFYASRGCPYECAFCSNPQLHRIFRGKGRCLRFKEPIKLVEEIEIERRNGAFNFILFTDDLFTTDKAWLREFTKFYKTRVGIPFACQSRPEFTTEETLSFLRDGGCEKIVFGIETGNEELRTKVLNKKIKNDDIIKMSNLVRKNGMKLHTYNIFGLPGETLENSFETIDLNVKIKSDIIASFMYMPFPDTELCQKGIKLGMIKSDYSFSDMPSSFHRKSVMKSPVIHKQENLHKIIFFAVKYPRFIPFIKKMVCSDNRIIKFMLTPVFFGIFIISFFYRYKGENNSIWEMVKFIYRCRKAY